MAPCPWSCSFDRWMADGQGCGDQQEMWLQNSAISDLNLNYGSRFNFNCIYGLYSCCWGLFINKGMAARNFLFGPIILSDNRRLSSAIYWTDMWRVGVKPVTSLLCIWVVQADTSSIEWKVNRHTVIHTGRVFMDIISPLPFYERLQRRVLELDFSRPHQSAKVCFMSTTLLQMLLNGI